MEILDSKHLDHHGLVAGVLKDLGIKEKIDTRLGDGIFKKVTDGTAVSAMIVNSLGFTSRPLSLTPQFFESKALDILFGDDITADDLNRHRLGRCLDDIYEYGCDLLFSEVAQEVCNEEGISQEFSSLDTTSFTVTGNYDVDTDENEVTLTHGFSKDHRPDLKQIVQEMMVSQDGGVPLMSKTFSGNESDSKIFTERCRTLLSQFKNGSAPKYIIADTKLYSEKNAANLKSLNFITRIPRMIKKEPELVLRAIQDNKWTQLDKANRYREFKLTHNDIDQRWFVVYSNAAKERSKKTLQKQIKKEQEKTRLELKHLRNEQFNCEADAIKSLNKIDSKLKYHCLTEILIEEKACYAGKGRPKKSDLPTHHLYMATAEINSDKVKQQNYLSEKACYVIGTNIAEKALTPESVIAAYKNQNASIERGFRFLKDPYFFTSSFFIKKPSRIMALLMIMTLALMIYSIAQRRLRNSLAQADETLPNQINQPTKKPTIRWVFQILEGISVVYVKSENKIQRVITGLTELKKKIIMLFCADIRVIYQLSENAKSAERV